MRERIALRERLALGNKAKEEEHLREIYRRVSKEKGMDTSFGRPNRLRENAEIAISCRGRGPAAKKKEVYQ